MRVQDQRICIDLSARTVKKSLFISQLLGCCEKTIQQGLSDLANEEQLKKNG
jgi:hypothetical protein